MFKKLLLINILLILELSCKNKLKYIKNDIVFPPTSKTEIFNDFIPNNINDNQIVTYSYYKVSFSKKHKQASWVFYMLTKEMLEKNASRTDDFRIDTNVINCATLSDYKNSSYDRGHLIPAGDMTFDYIAMSETFFMTNISPQNPSFNRGKWASLEDKFREWVIKYDTIFIVTAGILNDNIKDFIGNNVSIPNHFYKIALVYKKNTIKAIAFKMENKKLDEELSFYTTNIREIENLTGIDFFYLINKEKQDIFELENNYNNW